MSIVGFLQGGLNQFTLTFEQAKDKTYPTGYVPHYRYRIIAFPLAEVGGYISELTNSELKNTGSWVDFSDDDAANKDLTISIPVPTYDYDVHFTVELEAWDDGTKSYSESTLRTSEKYYAFYNRAPQYYIQSAEWSGSGDTEKISLVVQQNGYSTFKPYELSSMDNYQAYVADCLAALNQGLNENRFNPDYNIKLQYRVSSSSEYVDIVAFEPKDITNKIFDNFSVIINAAQIEGLESQRANYLTFGVESTSDTTYFDHASNGTFQSEPILLQSVTPACQIKRRALKVHMPKNNTEITGAAMFNRNDLVGHNRVAHSIALYDTHAEKAEISNKPSIGFIDNNHNQLGAVSWNGEGFEFTTDGIIFNVKNYNSETKDLEDAKVKLQFELYDGNPIFKMIPILPSEDEPET